MTETHKPQIPDGSKVYLVDIREVIDEYFAIPRNLRNPESVLGYRFRDDAELLTVEVEGILPFIDVKHQVTDGINQLVESFMDSFLDSDEHDMPTPYESLPKADKMALDRYCDVVAELAMHLSETLDQAGLYGTNGYLPGCCVHIFNGTTLAIRNDEDDDLSAGRYIWESTGSPPEPEPAAQLEMVFS